MQVPSNHFKSALRKGEMQLGLWSGLSSHVTVELLANAGFDWLLLDTEHSPNELPMVHSQLQAIARGAAHPIVRPVWNDTVNIKRYLDIGVQTLLIPYVQDADEARQAVAATRYPPLGVRGYAAAARASDFGRIKDYPSACEEQLCVLVQVETPLGPGEYRGHRRGRWRGRHLHRSGRPSRGHGPYRPDRATRTWWPPIDDAIARILACGKPAGILAGDERLARHSDRRLAPASSPWAAMPASSRAAPNSWPPNTGTLPEPAPVTIIGGRQHEQNRFHRPRHHGHAHGGDTCIKGGHKLYLHHAQRRAAGAGRRRAASPARAAKEVAREGRDHHHHGARHAGRRGGAVRRGRRRGGPVGRQDRGRHELDLADRDQGVRASGSTQLGCDYLDAPVSGGEVGAKSAAADDHGRRPARRRSTGSSRCSS